MKDTTEKEEIKESTAEKESILLMIGIPLVGLIIAIVYWYTRK